MVTVSLLMAAGVLTTADFCASPIDGGRGDPEYCRLPESDRVETPYLSIVTDSRFLIGVDQQGRRIMVGFSQHQNQAGLVIEVIELGQLSTAAASDPTLKRYLDGTLICEPRTLGKDTWDWCVEDEWELKSLPQYYFHRAAGNVYYIQHYASGLGREQDPAIADLLASIVVSGT